eukprot:scaffold18147_cov82-Attheya_sp.AAC.1
MCTQVDLELVVEETLDEWIRSRKGIAQHLDTTKALEDGDEVESLKTLGTQAAKNALEMWGLDPLDIDFVICATSSHDDMFGDATSIAAGLGATNSFAYDLTAACSRFLFATVMVGQFLHCGSIKNAIVVGADALSRWVDWEDRDSCILFGDGAGTMVLTNNTDHTENSIMNGLPRILGYATHSNGKGYNDLKCADKGTEQLVDAKYASLPPKKYPLY